jgi:isoleucyl-tRNA synthetase
VNVTREDVEILHEEITGWIVESDGLITVALDTALTPELLNEGFAREFVNRVQNLRKEAGFEVTDRIRIRYSSESRLSSALTALADYVKSETLAVEFAQATPLAAGAAEWDINGELCAVSIERVTNGGK